MSAKKLFPMIGLAVVLVLCILLYLVVPQKNNDEDADSATDTSVMIDTLDTDAVKKLTIQNGENTFTLKKSEDQWVFADDADIPVDQEEASELLENFATVSATKQLTENDDTLSNFGLSKPALTLTVTMSDGAEHTYLFGDTVPVIGGYYVKASGHDETVYCVDESLYTAVNKEKSSLYQVAELPDIDDDAVTSVTLTANKKIAYQAKKVAKSDRINSAVEWNIVKPNEKPVAASDSDWDTTLSYFTSLSFDQVVEYGGADKKKYGLQEPSWKVLVHYTESESNDDSDSSTDSNSSTSTKKEKKTFTLLIGKKNKDGDYYACEKGSKDVYTISAYSVEDLMGVTTYNTMDKTVYPESREDLQSFDVIYEGTKQSWKSDDDSDSVSDIYVAIQKLSYTGEATKKIKKKNAVMTLVFHEKNKDVTVNFYPYDDNNFYLVDKDGMDDFVVDQSAVQKILKLVNQTES